MNTCPFPKPLLQVLNGSFRKQSNGWYLELNLAPFDLPNEYPDGDELSESYKKIETNFRIDFWDIQLEDFNGKTLEFEPPNNDIDGSIYIGFAHHPVDIIKLDGKKLPSNSDESGSLRIDAIICFEFEGLGYGEETEYGDTPCSFNLTLTPAQDGWDIKPTQPL